MITNFQSPNLQREIITYKIALLALKRGITRLGEIIQTRKKIRVSYFLMRNPYMKFQNPSLNSVLNGRKDERTDERTSRKQYAPHFFKVGGIKTRQFLCQCISV